MINGLDDFKVYNLVMDFAENIWSVVARWNNFQKDTIGKQLVRSADSIAVNRSEGLGRYHFKDSKNFGYYSRGSLFESKTWLNKSYNRGLIDRPLFEKLNQEIERMGKRINGYINSIGEVSEPLETYGENPHNQAHCLIPRA